MGGRLMAAGPLDAALTLIRPCFELPLSAPLCCACFVCAALHALLLTLARRHPNLHERSR